MENNTGNRLKKRREELNYTIEEVAASTRLRKEFIVAMENGNYDLFPAEVYLVNFLRKYGEYLGIDTEEMVHEIRAVPTRGQSRLTDVSLSLLKKKHGRSRIMAKEAVAVLLLAAMAGLWLFLLLRRGDAVLQARKEKEPVAVESKAPADEKQAAVRIAGEKIRLGVRIITDTWVKIVSDGSTVAEAILPAGYEKTFSAGRELRIRIGNVYGMELKRDGEKIDIIRDNYGSVNELLLEYRDGKISMRRPPVQPAVETE